ncbi:MAG: formate dehydrogenase subunit alpha [Deltaproteobacteria bacterium]|nr:formate dehydrogenase subunit alpha [Deltaproteobacteria bacterium]MBI3386129.1 formate dehydrogenase subunit alpha [Deltaproteobacteria bacterium]
MSMIRLSIDGRAANVRAGTTIWAAAQQSGIQIPVLCHDPQLRPVGVCRVCTVDVQGARTLQAACVRPVEDGMVVRTATASVLRARRTLVELLLADHPSPCAKEQVGHCALEHLGRDLGIGLPRFAARAWHDHDDTSSPVIAVDHRACILCDRCIRACNEVQSNEVIGRAEKGYATRIAFDLGQPMGNSTCVSCGECAAACPTGALIDKPVTQPRVDSPSRSPELLVDSVCPYCGVGCAIQYHVRDGTLVQVSGRADSPVNQGRLCVKGRYGFDYAHHPQRLTVPLIRRSDRYPKGALSPEVRGDERGHRPGGLVNYDDVLPAFREATWDEALDLIATRLRTIKETHGGAALAGFGSAKCSNEDNYIFQKLVRAVFGTNNVDHCTRLCHASSVAALMETIGSGAVSNVFADVALADVVLVIGSNATENHPVAATFMKAAAKRGSTLIVIDPRRPPLADHADYYLRFKPGTDVALLNGLMHVIIRDRLVNADFVRDRTEGFDALRTTVQHYPPDVVARITGVPADIIETVAGCYGRARGAMIFWGMGISQHTTGTDNARCLISLALMTGNIGRPGTGLHPLRGQNNVQGASDVGLIPMVFTDYQSVTDPAVRASFERAWGVPLDPNPGLTVVEIMSAAQAGTIRGMLMMGENPFLSDPNTNKVRKALAALDFLAVQDIFLTETAEFADVILPATSFAEKEGTYTNTDRRVQLGRKAVEPPGQARTDWQILCDIATRMGYPMRYQNAEEIFREMTSLTPSYAGLSYERLGSIGMLWPCPSPTEPGTAVLFTEQFPRGKGKFVPAEFAPAKELPDDKYPYVLNTGRLLEHWHTGTMTRRSKALDALEPEAYAELHPEDLRSLGLDEHDLARISSRRGAITIKVHAGERTAQGSVFIPFHFREAAANVLTIDALDPFGKIPEFKFCAVRIERAR